MTREAIRHFAKLWGFAAFVVVVAYVFRAVLLPFVLAITLAYVLAPAITWLTRWQLRGRAMPRGLAVVICYCVFLSGLGLFLAAFLPRLSWEFARLGREAPGIWERAQSEWTPRTARWLEQHFPSLAPSAEEATPAAQPREWADLPAGTVVTLRPIGNGEYAVALPAEGIEIERRDNGRIVVQAAEGATRRPLEEVLRARLAKAVSALEVQVSGLVRLGQAVVTGVVTTIMKLFLVLMVAAFVLVDMERIHASARGLIPERYRAEYDHVVLGIDRGLAGVIRGQILICLVNGVLTFIGLTIFHVKYGLLLAAMAAVLSLIPIFGSILSSVPIVGVALVSGATGIDFLRGVSMLAWILGIHFLEANFLNPSIIGSAAKMHPLVVIFALIAGEHTYGLAGALLAVPVASIIQTLFIYFRSQAWKP